MLKRLENKLRTMIGFMEKWCNLRCEAGEEEFMVLFSFLARISLTIRKRYLVPNRYFEIRGIAIQTEQCQSA
jgi:hypothetical protein